MFRSCYFRVLKGCHNHYYTYSRPLHHFWSSNREIKRKHQNLKQLLIISINMRLFVNRCASALIKCTHRSRPRESIQLSSEPDFEQGNFDKESTTQGSNSRAPGVNLSVWQSNNLKAEMLPTSKVIRPIDCFIMCASNVPHVGLETARYSNPAKPPQGGK